MASTEIDPADAQIAQVDAVAGTIEVGVHEFRELLEKVREMHEVITQLQNAIHAAGQNPGMLGMMTRSMGL